MKTKRTGWFGLGVLALAAGTGVAGQETSYGEGGIALDAGEGWSAARGVSDTAGVTAGHVFAAVPSVAGQPRHVRAELQVVRGGRRHVRGALQSVRGRRQALRAELANLRARLRDVGARVATSRAREVALSAAWFAGEAGPGGVGEATGEWSDVTPPPAWLQQDPGDSLYRAGREALNDRDHRRAARLFEELIESHPTSGYAPDAYFYQAFALHRAGRVDDLNEALSLLETLLETYPDAATAGEAERLKVRVEGQLARRGDVESTRRLVDHAVGPCTGEDYDVRAMALSALINMDADRAMPILREVLRNRDDCPELRKQAVFLISQHGGPEVVDLMLDLAHRDPDPDPEVRGQAVFWLSQVDAPEAVDALEAILEGSQDSNLQEQALFALSQHDSPRALAILRSYAERDDAPVELRGNAIFWVSQHEALGLDYLLELWSAVTSRELREQILFGVSQSDDPRAARWLLERARDADLHMELRKNALFWAAQGDDVDVADLVELYRMLPERELREQILFGLSQMDSRESVDVLMDVARSEDDPELRENAVFWLGQSDDPRVADFLLELIRR